MNSSLVKAPDLYNSFRVFNCLVKSLLLEASILGLDFTYKFEGFIIFKKSVEPLHFSTQIDIAMNNLSLCVVKNIS